MSEQQGQDRALSNEANLIVEESPTEKLRGDSKPGAKIPGTQNPESEEIRKEVNPNTE